ncbi:hypothetical protein A2U01_0033153 [Trifolium medium]|uniref:Uncharacterized protein n=1 Tax=Trifolium medium TaxID=97028 RepID=A0A392PKQ7_9FABA|nr:hypothetical protein [Trifolium medium]
MVMLLMFPGMLAYRGWRQDFTLNNMVVKVMFGLARPFTESLARSSSTDEIIDCGTISISPYMT